jgi:hypothetical protein
MRDAFKYLTSLFFAALLVQFALAAYGAFHAVDTAKDGRATKDAVEHGFSAHVALGWVIVVVLLLLVIVAAVGRLGSPWLQMSGGLLVAGILQVPFAALGRSVAALGFLHGVNAVAIYAVAALLAHRAWTRRPDAVAV